MGYEWDAAKAATNIVKHGVAFERIEDFDWASARIEAAHRPGDREVRLKASGLIDSRVHVVIYVIRRTSLRLISLRPASRQETRNYDTQED